ncbi:MAG: tetratricopeptide repeat protein [Symploca sp. SIO2C1]|nr:tetratricopeptide repeat protein [Symploca sp. SIO2C1]
MPTEPHKSTVVLSEADSEELESLVSTLELSDSDGTTIVFAVAPESGPRHPVVERLKSLLAQSEEGFRVEDFFFSDRSLINFLYSFNEAEQEETQRRVLLVFGMEQLPTPPRLRALKDLNLGRDRLFRREMVLIFWLNRRAFLDELRNRAPDFWDWRGKVVYFEARPLLDPLFYPYLEWLIAQKSYLKISGVIQVQRQVDIFLDQVYISLQGVRKQEVVCDVGAKHLGDNSSMQPKVYSLNASPSASWKTGSRSWDGEEWEEELVAPAMVATKTVTKKLDLAEAVRDNQYSVILGEPGAGKTTLLNYLALHQAQAQRDILEKAEGRRQRANGKRVGETSKQTRRRETHQTRRMEIPPKISLTRREGAEGKKEGCKVEGNDNCLSELDIRAYPSSIGLEDEGCLPDLGEARLPVFLRIADYAEKLAQQPELSLLEFLGQFYREWEVQLKVEVEQEGEVAPLLCKKMRNGECIVLLDGLDEVFDQTSRLGIVEQIEQFVRDYPHNKYVITSRIAGYRDVKLSDRFSEFTITDMATEQVEQFLHRWCLAIEKAQKPEASPEFQERAAEEEAGELLKAIQDNEGVKRLTGNPLLLTILALIHRNGSRLPHRRVELYALAVKTLIEDWQLHKNLPEAPKVLLKESEVVELLAPLAYWMHEHKPSGLVSEAEVTQQLALKLAELSDEEPEAETVQQAVEQFLRKVRETTGLFVERAPGFYGFMHLTFEEYFAARQIADNREEDILDIIVPKLHESRWQEPILLALGYLGGYSRKLTNGVVEKLFRNLEAYQPVGEIRIKNGSSEEATLIWLKSQNDSRANLDVGAKHLGDNSLVQPNTPNPNASPSDDLTEPIYSELPLRDLRFAGEVLAQVEVKTGIRTKQIDKLVLTVLGLDTSLYDYFQNDVTKQLLRLLRQIELFNQKGEVITRLQQAVDDSTLSDEIGVKARLAILYVACGKAGTELVNRVTEIVHQLEPTLFWWIKDLVEELGEEMTPALETTRQNYCRELESQRALTFLTAMSYLRADNYDKAIALLEEITEQPDNSFSCFLAWALAACHQAKSEYKKALEYYQQSFTRLSESFTKTALHWFWDDWGLCDRLDAKYEQSLECSQQRLVIAQEIKRPDIEANALCEIGRVYQSWGKYEDAIAHYQQSGQLYEQLEQQQNVANRWYRLADCYRAWGKYQQAVEYQQQCLAIRQQLEDQSLVAVSYYQLGRIYQDWDKYEQAIAYYQESRQLYEQLERKQNIANQWYNLADCYRTWGKYEQAVECELQDLAICQELEEQSQIALAYYQLGRIYQDWSKYENAIAQFQKSRQLYEQLERKQNIANQWYWLGDSYRAWSKYQQAVEHQQQCLTIRQQLEDQSLVAVSYYQLGRIYQDWGKYENAIAYYQQSRQLYEQLERHKDVANQWYNLAGCYRAWSKYEQAVECELKDLAISQQLEDQSEIAGAYYQLGRIYQDWGKYEDAIAQFQQSRQLYEQLDLQQNVANQWDWLSYCYQNWGKYEEALECQQQCLSLCQKLDNKLGIANAYNQGGRVYQDCGKYQDAIAHYQKSRQLYEQLDLQQNLANQWYSLADCYREWSKYQQAIEHQQECLTIRQKLEKKSDIANAYWQLGIIYQDWGKYQDAIAYYQQSRQLYEQLERHKDVANLWYNLADCYREWSKYQQAVEHQQQYLAIRQQLEDQSLVALSYYQLGRIYQDWGKYKDAIAYYQQSRQLYEQLERKQNVATRWYNLADCYRAWGKYQQAVENQQQCLTICQQLEDQSLVAVSYYQLGRIYQDWGKYEDAIAQFQKSCQLYEQLDLQQGVANQWSWIAESYRDSGDYTKAIEYYQQSYHLHQKLSQDESTAKRLRNIGKSQCLLAKNTPDTAAALNLLTQAEENIRQAIQLNTAGDYKQNLAYDYTTLGFLWSERLRLLYQIPVKSVNCHAEGDYVKGSISGDSSLRYRSIQNDKGEGDSTSDSTADSVEGSISGDSSLCYRSIQNDKGEGDSTSDSTVDSVEGSISGDSSLRYRSIQNDKGEGDSTSDSTVDSVEGSISGDSSLCYRSIQNDKGEGDSTRDSTVDSVEGSISGDSSLCYRSIQNDKGEGDSTSDSTVDSVEGSISGDSSLCYGSAQNDRLEHQNEELEHNLVLPTEDSSLSAEIAQFEEYYHTGLTYLTELGKTVARAEESLDMARAYLEVKVLQNLDKAEAIAQESLQIFQDYNRHKLVARAQELLEELKIGGSSQCFF